jgi:hypothetical protein
MGVDVPDRDHADNVFVCIDHRHMPDSPDPHQLGNLINGHVIAAAVHVTIHGLVDQLRCSVIGIAHHPNHVTLGQDAG